MGIFSEWRLFTDPEVLLEECIDANPFHPFQMLDMCTDSNPLASQPPVYVYSCRFRRFYTAVLMCVVSLLFIIIWPAAGGDTEYLLFGFVALLLSVYVCVEYYSVRRLVLEPDTHHYSVYKGAMLIATEHCHNIYIRLLTKSSGSHSPTYYLVLDGVGLEAPIHLTKGTTNKKKLRHLAHVLTSNLSLNYFDIHDTSKHRILIQQLNLQASPVEMLLTLLFLKFNLFRYHTS